MRIVDLENAISLDPKVNFILNSCYLLLVFNSCHLIVLFKFLSFTYAHLWLYLLLHIYAFQVFVEILHLVLLSSHLLSCTLLSCTLLSLQFTFLYFNFQHFNFLSFTFLALYCFYLISSHLHFLLLITQT
ncbi:uncharacterized protein DS421_15g515020 [Arachis hypogaea]|nr:uncharacterized protein DS421_15g515020 [Arachis hypogaea]